MTTGERLKLFLLDKFGSVTRASEKLDVNVTTFYDYFHNKTKPGFVLISKLKPYGLSADWLLFGEGDKINEPIDKYFDTITRLESFISRIDEFISKLSEEDEEYYKKNVSKLLKQNKELGRLIIDINEIYLSTHKISDIEKITLSKNLYILTDTSPVYFKSQLVKQLNELKDKLVKLSQKNKDK